MHPALRQLFSSRNPAVRARARQLARNPKRALAQLAQAQTEVSALQRQLHQPTRPSGGIVTGATRPTLPRRLEKDGPATGSPAVAADVYTPNAGRGIPQTTSVRPGPIARRLRL